MAEFYDIYPKDRWKDPSYRLMDKFSLKGKKGFVTGGCGGIGRNVAAAWAEAGADVALVDIPAAKERLEPLCKEMSERYGVKMQQIALAWLWARGVASHIIGATKAAHFDDAAGALDVKLTREDIAYLEETYAPHRIVGAIDRNPAEGVMLLDEKK